ncbi:MAG: hypothetical protein IT340_16095, partial [Chloroflexi bacterium]|nr:hypothetical protein [Chloroflexota bacterium]
MSQLAGPGRRAWQALRTIRVRLTLWYVALLAVILVLFSGVLYLGLARSMQAEADARLMSDTQQVLASVEIEGDRLDAPLRSDYMPAGLEVTLYNQRGQRLFTTDPDRLLPRLGREEVAAVRGPWRIDVVRGADGAEWRQLTGPVLEGSRQLGVVQTARPEAELTAALRDLGAVMALAIPATLLLASAG